MPEPSEPPSGDRVNLRRLQDLGFRQSSDFQVFVPRDLFGRLASGLGHYQVSKGNFEDLDLSDLAGSSGFVPTVA